jgi:N-acetylglucosamine malate deacetylase 1
MKVMFCGAHPDDAEIYSFGTLFAYAERGAEVVLVLATSGEKGAKVRSPHQPLAVTRLQEAENAAAMMLARVVPLGLPDAGLSQARIELFLRLKQLITQENPNIILTHSANDYHPDHRALSNAVAMAAQPQVPVLFVDNMKGKDFTPTHYVNITDFQAQKMLALRQHHSQKPFRYVRAATELARQRGYEATGRKGILMEAFRCPAYPAHPNLSALFPRGTMAAPSFIYPYTPPAADKAPSPKTDAAET